MRDSIVRQGDDKKPASETVEQYMQMPPWLAAIRDAMAGAIKPEDLASVMAAQVEKAKKGDARAAAFVMDQAHKLLQAEQRRPITVTQTNNYYEGDVRPDVPATAEPNAPKTLKKLAGRVAAGLPIKHPSDRRIAEHLRVDNDDEEKELRRRQAEAEDAA